MAFPCIGCGLCCRSVAGRFADFPHPVLADGSCSKFDPVKNQCTIYESRPVMCRVEEGLEYSGYQGGKLRWFNANINACNLLLEDAGRPERIPMMITGEA
jgi:Fe-S-cluster containining protein